jgi:hypothetical protein
MLKGILNIAINRLIEAVSIKVLDKRKLKDKDSVTLDNNKIELFCDTFRKLR